MKAIMSVTDQEFSEILNRLKQSLVIQLDVGTFINDRNNGHQSWLPAKRADFDFFFWNRYKKYLEEVKHWNPRVTANLGKVSDEILDLCGDPSEKQFSIRGLVLGDVQSGKTANYTAICNKAADTGYRIIIILAGIQENLRQQTQERLDGEFTGRRSEYYLDPKAEQGIKNTPVGVGRYGRDKKVAAFTSVTKDFDTGVLQSNNLGIENVNCPVVLVVKKNKRILNNLIKWLSKNNTLNAAGQIELPLMLIDDEADNASVNTKDSDSSPAAINDCIRRLLGKFSKHINMGMIFFYACDVVGTCVGNRRSDLVTIESGCPTHISWSLAQDFFLNIDDKAEWLFLFEWVDYHMVIVAEQLPDAILLIFRGKRVKTDEPLL